jgi:phosphatidylserine/phosphatidylglycerophosphate/cardiolipin synthase-like enzyme
MLRLLQDRAKAGVEIRIIGKVAGNNQFTWQKLAGTRLHTRTILRDGRQAFVGSQSLRALELDSRRELGLIIHDSKAVKKLIDTFESDWEAKKNGKEPAMPEEIEQPASDVPTGAEAKQTEKAVQALKKELSPLADTVKKAVRKAVAKAGDEVLEDKDVKDTMKKVVKRAVKEAVKEAAEESQEENPEDEREAS